MKRVFAFSVITILSFVVIAGCSRQRDYIDESYWLSRERATVVFSDPSCQFYIVEAINGYSVIRTWNGIRPYEGTVLYGDFSNYGVRDFYNRSQGIIITGEVIEYWLSYYEAQQAAEYYCYY